MARAHAGKDQAGPGGPCAVAPRPRGRPSVEQSGAIRRQIVSVATEEFVDSGYERASMDRIAARAGSTKTTLYRLFASKDELFVEALRSALAGAVARLPDIDPAGEEPEAALRAFARAMRASYREGRSSALWHSVLAVRRQFPELFREISDLMNQETIASRLARYFERATARGALAVPRPDVAARHFALLVGPAQEWSTGRADDLSEEERLEEIIGLFVRGYAA